MKPKHSRLIPQKKLTIAIAIALTIPTVGIELANAQDNGVVEEITITGSRIVRLDYEANSPIQTVDSEMFDTVSTIGIESALNQLPQFIPAATQFTNNGTTTDTGSTVTAGASTLSLRGLAPNRNLVLLDGRRAMPVNATMAVDINSIPSAAVQRVEVITGGASSVYGADAVAGVVNFILKKDFEGVDIDMQYGEREDGTGGEARLAALFGANFSDGRGNIMMGIEYADRRAVDRIDTDFYRDGLFDPTVPGTQLFHSDSYYSVDGNNAPSGASIDSIFDQAPANTVLRNTTGTIPNGARLHFNDDNSLYTGAGIFSNANPQGAGSTAGTYRYNGPLNKGSFPFRKVDAQGEFEENIEGHKASTPLERFSFFARGNYEIIDGISAFAQATMVETSTKQLWQWSPAANGWGATIPHGDDPYLPSLTDPNDTNSATLPAFLAGGNIGLNCAALGGCSKSEAFPTPSELNSVLDSRDNGGGVGSGVEENWALSHMLDYAPARQLDTSTRSFQVSFGLDGRLDAIDGTWDIVASHGTSITQINQLGFAGLERYRAVVQSPNYGQGFFRGGNPQGNGFSGGLAQCTTGLPVFREHSDVSQDCLDAFEVTLQNNAEMRQDYVEANVQGRLFDMPAGEVRFSLGSQWRKNDYRYIFDTLTTQNSFLDLSLGTFPADNTEGSTSVKEVYGELFVPILSDLPGIQHFNLELGYRYSDYELQGGIDTYKVLADWAITDELRFRGGYQLASRAPNIAELFQAKSQTWGFGVGDMCGLNNIQEASANPANGAQAAHARTICEGLMGSVGATAFYDPANTQPNGFSGIWFANAVGNPDVAPEEATTLTAGFVYQPSSDNVILDGFSTTVDWFSIKIEDMIAVEADSTVYTDCLSLVSNPTGDLNNPSCSRIIRNPTSGGTQAVDVTYANTGFSEINGVDVQANWGGLLSDLGIDSIPGSIGLNFMVSTILKFETQSSSTAPVYDWKGTLGPGPETSLNGGAFDYRTFVTFNYSLNDWNASLRWRHLPEADAAGTVFAAGNQIPDQGADESYDIVDFSASWTVNDTYQVRLGIDNLFDTDAVITGAESDYDGNRPTSGAGTTMPGFYDVLGRRFYVGVKANF